MSEQKSNNLRGGGGMGVNPLDFQLGHLPAYGKMLSCLIDAINRS
jgi:hypothetical protein